MKKVIGYLGPEGTYSHEVALHIGQGCKLVALESSKFSEVIRNKKIQQAVLPVVNAIGWQVQWVLDILLNGNGEYQITREIIWDIKSHLIGFGKISEVSKVFSHSQPLDQCKGFLANIPGVITASTDSTGIAVAMVARQKSHAFAAIGTEAAAKLYGVPIIAKGISDHSENQTKFIVLGGRKTPQTGHDTTSFIIGTSNKPGALLRAQEVFDALDINMSELFSMPSPNRRLGECFFFVSVDGHKKDKDLSVAIEKIRNRVEYLKVLGSYRTENTAANAV